MIANGTTTTADIDADVAAAMATAAAVTVAATGAMVQDKNSVHNGQGGGWSCMGSDDAIVMSFAVFAKSLSLEVGSCMNLASNLGACCKMKQKVWATWTVATWPASLIPTF